MQFQLWVERAVGYVVVAMGKYSSKCRDGGGGGILRIFGQIESNKVFWGRQNCQKNAFLSGFFHKNDLSLVISSQTCVFYLNFLVFLLIIVKISYFRQKRSKTK